jgi:hypothetical protein
VCKVRAKTDEGWRVAIAPQAVDVKGFELNQRVAIAPQAVAPPAVDEAV